MSRANGAIAGNDTRIIPDGQTGKFIDLIGIDNHTINQVELVSCGSYVESDQGPIILIMHQYARMPDAKTIHSCIQMEANIDQVYELACLAVRCYPCVVTRDRAISASVDKCCP